MWCFIEESVMGIYTVITMCVGCFNRQSALRAILLIWSSLSSLPLIQVVPNSLSQSCPRWIDSWASCHVCVLILLCSCILSAVSAFKINNFAPVISISTLSLSITQSHGGGDVGAKGCKPRARRRASVTEKYWEADKLDACIGVCDGGGRRRHAKNATVTGVCTWECKTMLDQKKTQTKHKNRKKKRQQQVCSVSAEPAAFSSRQSADVSWDARPAVNLLWVLNVCCCCFLLCDN